MRIIHFLLLILANFLTTSVDTDNGSIMFIIHRLYESAASAMTSDEGSSISALIRSYRAASTIGSGSIVEILIRIYESASTLHDASGVVQEKPPETIPPEEFVRGDGIEPKEVEAINIGKPIIPIDNADANSEYVEDFDSRKITNKRLQTLVQSIPPQVLRGKNITLRNITRADKVRLEQILELRGQ